jgi:Tol biopolymer transport system component
MLDPAPRWRRSLPILAAVLLLSGVGCAPLVSAAVRPGVPNVASLSLAASTIRQTPETPSGRILYVRDGNLWLWQGGTSHQFSEGGTWSQPSFSPGGKEIAYVYWTENFSDVFVMAADGSRARRLTRGQSSNVLDNSWAFRPAWSPDGERIAFVSDAASRFPQLWVMGPDGDGRRQIALADFYEESWVDSLAWDPKGGRVAVTGAPNMRDPSHVYLVDMAKGTAEKLTNHSNGAFDPSWSPDGATIAYIGRAGSHGELWVRTIEGKKEARLDRLSFARSPAWSPDGTSIAVLAQQNGAFEIFVLSVRSTADGFELGEPRQLTRDAAVDPMSGLTWAP